MFFEYEDKTFFSIQSKILELVTIKELLILKNLRLGFIAKIMKDSGMFLIIVKITFRKVHN